MIRSNSEAFSDRAFQVFLSVTLVLICASVVYPLYFVIVASFSDPDYVINGYVWLYPRKPNVQAYEKVLEDEKIWRSYRNTFAYTSVGVLVSSAVDSAGCVCVVEEGFPLPQPVHGLLRDHHVFQRRPDTDVPHHPEAGYAR